VVGGRYCIEACLGDGGMGTVYRARHVVLDKAVAIKILREARDGVARRRFLQEARSASSVQHANIIDISDYGVLEDGHPYLIMELLTGQTLAQVMAAAAPLPPRRACLIGAQIAHALAAVHDKGIVHRDLKPDNIFLLTDPQQGLWDFVKIVDFGIAKVMTGPRLTRAGLGRLQLEPAFSGETFTCDGMIIGTPEYMSPEQIIGQEVDHRADQYALGCLLYEMLTGVLPFNHLEPEAILRKHVMEPPIPPRERRPNLDIPAGLEAAVLRALAKDRADRFPTMRDMEEALRREVEAEGPVHQTHARALAPAQERGRERRALRRTVPLAATPPQPAGAVPLPTLVTPTLADLHLPGHERREWALAGGAVLAALLLWVLAPWTESADRGFAPVRMPNQLPVQVVPVSTAVEQPVISMASSLPPAPTAQEAPHVKFQVQGALRGGVHIRCAARPGPLSLRCQGRCAMAWSGPSRCVASYPGYVRHVLQVGQGDLARPVRFRLRACTFESGEDCEPAPR
jgi:serine/threonine-protein kinase